MSERFIRGLARLRWVVLAVWLAIAVAAMFGLPDLRLLSEDRTEIHSSRF